MVRKTKQESLATRAGILDAAERLFHEQGVSRTSLQDIASGAGVTRGAIYWHFKDKGALFNAMMERVCLPIEQSMAVTLDEQASIKTVREHLLKILAHVAGDARVQRVFDIATHKVEYVDELVAVRERHLSGRRGHLDALEVWLRAAQRRGEIVGRPPAAQIAIGLQALLDGLIQNWMLDPAAFDLLAVGRQALDVHLAGLAPRS